MAQKQITVTATMSRNYGPVTMTYSASEVIQAVKHGDAIKAHHALTQVLKASFEQFDTHDLPKLPIPQAKGIEGDTKPKPAQWFIAKEMYMTMNEKGRFFNIRTTNNPLTNKFGAAVYFDRFTGMTKDEFMQGADPDTIKIVFPEGMRVLIETYKGKPRAIQLAHKDTIGEG
jgi:hypothetical protein